MSMSVRHLLRVSRPYAFQVSLLRQGTRTRRTLFHDFGKPVLLPPCTAAQAIIGSRNSYRFIHDEKASKEGITADTPGDANRKSGNSDQENNPQTTLTQTQRLRKIFAEYGSIGVGFHVCISLTSLGICYTAVSSGLDVPALLTSIGLSKGLSDSTLTTGASTFVIAYACHKVFVPVRMFLTITCTPLIVHKLRNMGILKAPGKTMS